MLFEAPKAVKGVRVKNNLFTLNPCPGAGEFTRRYRGEAA